MPRAGRLYLVIFALCLFARAQECGDAWYRCPAASGYAGGAGGAALLRAPAAAAANPPGSMYATLFGDYVIADRGTNTVRHAGGSLAAPASAVGTLSGGHNGTQPGFVDACAAPDATYAAPRGLVFTGMNALWVADAGNHVLRRMFLAVSATPPFYSFTVAAAAGGGGGGGATAAGFADGLGTAARLSAPWGLAYFSPTSSIYVADAGNHAIRRVGETKFGVTTVAGSGAPGDADGVRAAASFRAPAGLAVASSSGATASFSAVAAPDGNGTLYVADSGNALIRRIALTSGAVTTWLGRVAPVGPPAAGATGCVAGVGTAAQLGEPTGLALSAEPALYITDSLCNVIWRVTAAGAATVLAGQVQGPPPNAGRLDGIGGGAYFNAPAGLLVTASAPYSLLVADTGSNLLRGLAVSSASVITYAGPAAPTSSPSVSRTASPSPSVSALPQTTASEPPTQPSQSPALSSSSSQTTPASQSPSQSLPAPPSPSQALPVSPSSSPQDSPALPAAATLSPPPSNLTSAADSMATAGGVLPALALGLGLGLSLGALAAAAAAAIAVYALRRRRQRRRPAGLMSRLMSAGAFKAGSPPGLMFTHASPGGGLLNLNPLADMFRREGAGFQARMVPLTPAIT